MPAALATIVASTGTVSEAITTVDCTAVVAVTTFLSNRDPVASAAISCVGRSTPSSRRRRYQRDQLGAVMLELLVADAGNAAKFSRRRRTCCGDRLDRGVMQHHVGRHAAAARGLRAP